VAGITVVAERLDSIGGLCEHGNRIVLDPSLGERWRRAVFAHEFAHSVLSGGASAAWPADKELAADWLGDELCVPYAELKSIADVTIASISARFGVPSTRAASQLARAGLAAPISRLPGGEVICVRCGDRERSGCPCLYFRQNRHKVLRLPLVA
jgi:hypothetical protein